MRKLLAGIVSAIALSLPGCGNDCDHPADVYTLEESVREGTDYFADIEIKGPLEYGTRPDYYRVSCQVMTSYGRPSPVGFIMSMYVRSGEEIEGLAYRGPLAQTVIEAHVSADRIGSIDSIGCNLSIPERRVCPLDAEYCYTVEEQHVARTESVLSVVDEACLDWYYDAPDYEYRGGRNLR